jgi:hypothetical protein
MANLLIDDHAVTVSLSAIEKAEALHGDVVVPRAAIVGVRMVQDGMEEIHGLKTSGTGLSGVIKAGTWRGGSSIFAVCHGRRPAVVLDLTGQPYDRIVVTVEHPDEVVAGLM